MRPAHTRDCFIYWAVGGVMILATALCLTFIGVSRVTNLYPNLEEVWQNPKATSHGRTVARSASVGLEKDGLYSHLECP